jgi:hypothetical protein
MGRQIIKNPKGLYNIFSSVMDNWILVDATKEEVIEFHAEEAAKEARAHAERIIELIEHGKRTHFQFTMTYEEAEQRIKEVHE